MAGLALDREPRRLVRRRADRRDSMAQEAKSAGPGRFAPGVGRRVPPGGEPGGGAARAHPGIHRPVDPCRSDSPTRHLRPFDPPGEGPRMGLAGRLRLDEPPRSGLVDRPAADGGPPGLDDLDLLGRADDPPRGGRGGISTRPVAEGLDDGSRARRRPGRLRFVRQSPVLGESRLGQRVEPRDVGSAGAGTAPRRRPAQGRRRRPLLVPGHRPARLPLVPLSGQAVHPGGSGDRRAGGDGLRRPRRRPSTGGLGPGVGVARGPPDRAGRGGRPAGVGVGNPERAGRVGDDRLRAVRPLGGGERPPIRPDPRVGRPGLLPRPRPDRPSDAPGSPVPWPCW